MMYFISEEIIIYINIFYKELQWRGNEKIFVAFVALYSPSAGQTPRSQAAIVFSVLQTIIFRKHLFLHFCYCLCGYWLCERIVMTVTDFYFYFKILYELCISNDAIILPVCNICVEMPVYEMLLFLLLSLSFWITDSVFLCILCEASDESARFSTKWVVGVKPSWIDLLRCNFMQSAILGIFSQNEVILYHSPSCWALISHCFFNCVFIYM